MKLLTKSLHFAFNSRKFCFLGILVGRCFEIMVIESKMQETKDQGTHKNISVAHKWVPTQWLGNSAEQVNYVYI